MLPVSNDTLLRVVRRRTALRTDPLTVVGIDDWAFRRNRRYGTIVCDLEQRRIVTLLPDREVATVRAWLADHPGIKIVSRDRGGGCQGATGYGSGRRSLAPDGERQRGLPRRSAQVHARNPQRDRYANNHPRATHLGRKAAIRELSAAGGYKCSNRQLARDGLSIKQIVRRLTIQFDRRCGADEPICSKRGSARSTRTICSLKASGTAVAAMALNSGVACRRKGSGDPCAPLVSGQHADVGQKRSANNSCKGFPQPELSRIS